MNRKITAMLLIAAAVLTNAAFTVLGSVFNYPDILKEPTDEILATFREQQGAVTADGEGARSEVGEAADLLPRAGGERGLRRFCRGDKLSV